MSESCDNRPIWRRNHVARHSSHWLRMGGGSRTRVVLVLADGKYRHLLTATSRGERGWRRR